jgi:4'-phosphopantetheinyl transferase
MTMLQTTTWFRPPPESARLEGGAVHVWRCDEYAIAARLSALEQTLSLDERARAESFRFERERKRFVSCRGILRELLGNYLDLSPKSLTFTYSQNGKPQIEGHRLHFNLSHTQGVCLIAIALDQPVGTDVERIDRILDFKLIAQRFLPAEDSEAVNSSGDELLARTFYECWTRHEARLKLEGLTIDSEIASAATVSRLEMGPMFTGALACRKAPSAIRRWQFFP